MLSELHRKHKSMLIPEGKRSARGEGHEGANEPKTGQ